MEKFKQEFSELYDKYIAKIYRFIYLKVNSQEIAEDLSSEVFVRVWEVMSVERKEIENANAYLYQIARNKLADHYRGRKTQPLPLEENGSDIADPADPVEEKALQNLEMEQVQNALSKLNDDYQNYIIWRYLDEFSIPEIAQITGKNEQNVRVGIHRALQALKQQLTPAWV